MVWALRELRDPRAVRTLWKAHVYMYIRLYAEMLDALAAPGPATRQQLIGWLDSDDPVEFYGAVRHVLTPLDPQFWPPARPPRDGRNAR
jgi:hypothetical protein